MLFSGRLLALLASLVVAGADAATTVVLPGSMCPGGDRVFADGFDAPSAIPHDPSNGSGGAAPGDYLRSISVPGIGTRSYYVHVPVAYDGSSAWPLLVALHGSAGSAAAAPSYAAQIRADWSGIADAGGFIVLAPIATGSQGGWVVDPEQPFPNGDVAAILAEVADVESAYDIERSRVHLWGFSAGGHLAHWLALRETGLLAAYAVSAGALQPLTCTDAGPPTCASVLGGTPRKIPLDIHIGSSDPLYTYAIYDVIHDRQRFQAGGWVRNRNLFFLPSVPKSQVPAVLSAASIATSFVTDMPCLQDNSANKFFDALAAGRPIAINHGGWQAELIERERFGLVLPTNNSAAAGELLAKRVQDAQWLAEAGARAARVGRENFSADSAARRLSDVLHRVVNQA